MDEFYGLMRIHPYDTPYGRAKFDPFEVKGHWMKKDVGRPYMVWCNDGLYRNGINENICEVVEVEQ